MAAKPIGLTIEREGVRYLQLKKRNSESVHRKGFLPLPEGIIEGEQIANEDALINELIPFVKEEKLKGKTVTISIPSSQAIARRTTIASTNEAEIAQLLELEVQNSMHLPFEDPVYDFVPIGEPKEDTQEVIVFAAPRQLVLSYVGVLEEAGLKVEAVDLPALALARLVALKTDEDFHNVMLLDKHGDNLDIYLFSHGIPVLMRTMPLIVNANLLLDDVTAETSWLSDEIQAEISRMLNFFQFTINEGRERITKILVIGTSEDSLKLFHYLKDSFDDVNVMMAEVGESNTRSGIFDYRLPLGLALKGGARK